MSKLCATMRGHSTRGGKEKCIKRKLSSPRPCMLPVQLTMWRILSLFLDLFQNHLQQMPFWALLDFTTAAQSLSASGSFPRSITVHPFTGLLHVKKSSRVMQRWPTYAWYPWMHAYHKQSVGSTHEQPGRGIRESSWSFIRSAHEHKHAHEYVCVRERESPHLRNKNSEWTVQLQVLSLAMDKLITVLYVPVVRGKEASLKRRAYRRESR